MHVQYAHCISPVRQMLFYLYINFSIKTTNQDRKQKRCKKLNWWKTMTFLKLVTIQWHRVYMKSICRKKTTFPVILKQQKYLLITENSLNSNMNKFLRLECNKLHNNEMPKKVTKHNRYENVSDSVWLGLFTSGNEVCCTTYAP